MKPAISPRHTEELIQIKHCKPRKPKVLEKNIERQILAYLQYNPKLFAWKYPTTGRYVEKQKSWIKTKGTITGVADIICLGKTSKDRPFCAFFEVKREGSRQTDNQKEFERRVKQLNNFYFVVNCIEDVNCALIEIEKALD